MPLLKPEKACLGALTALLRSFAERFQFVLGVKYNIGSVTDWPPTKGFTKVIAAPAVGAPFPVVICHVRLVREDDLLWLRRLGNRLGRWMGALGAS